MIAEFERTVPWGAPRERVIVWEVRTCGRFAVAVEDRSTCGIVGRIEYFDDAEAAMRYAKELT